MARKEKPSGKEIAEKAKRVRLERYNSTQAEKNGKKVKFTAANLTHLESVAELEEGQFAGELETELEGDETGLPAGKYNIFIAKVNGTWHAYAESGGTIAAEAVRVTVEPHKEGKFKLQEPSFDPDGWCFCWCILHVWWWCLVRVCVCF